MAALAGCVSGCANYYKVTDPHTNAVYYSNSINRQSSGLVIFKDARTGQEVTLSESAIQEIPKEQFESGRAAPTTGPS